MKKNTTPQQLALLPSPTPSSAKRSSSKPSSSKPLSSVPLQFRLDEATRRRGLQHVAELRRLLAARQARNASDGQRRSVPRRAA
jgi:hypothetical protein